MIQRLMLPVLGLLAMSATASCPTPGQAQLAVIVDDIGYNRERGLAFTALPAPVTLAIIPATPHAKYLAQEGARRGKEIMVHMPMSSALTEVRDPIVLTAQLTDEAFDAVLQRAIDEVPGAKGMNNHMGSSLTQDELAMERLMRTLKEHDLFFIDSRTTAQTVAASTAKQHGLAQASRSVFLDNERDPLLISKHLLRAIAMAETNGSAVAIGHPYPETLAILTEYLGKLPDTVVLTPASTIARCTRDQSLTSIP